jgi:hypothetical protein
VIPDWKLERYRLGELSAEEKESVAAQVAADGTLQARLAALDADDAEVLAKYPRRHQAPAPSARRPFLVPALALAAALTVGLVALQALRPADDDVILLKGDAPALRLFRLVGTEPERLVDGARVKPHDVVQVAFDVSGVQHMVIVSVDGSNHTTLHWPHDGNTKVPVQFKALPDAFELDEAPGFERFFLVTSDVPLSVPDVVKAAEVASRAAPLVLPKTATQRSLLLEKVSP